MRGILVAMIASTVLVSSAVAQTIVVLDSWWNVDYAKNACSSAKNFYQSSRALIAQCGCDAVTGCPELMPAIQACQLRDPAVEVRDFEDRVVTQMASDPQCKGVHIVRYAGPDSKNPGYTKLTQSPAWPAHWTLFFDFCPGVVTQSWQLLRPEPSAFMKGEGDAREVASQVCAIVAGQGAKVN
jgi:hypothetical protein